MATASAGAADWPERPTSMVPKDARQTNNPVGIRQLRVTRSTKYPPTCFDDQLPTFLSSSLGQAYNRATHLKPVKNI